MSTTSHGSNPKQTASPRNPNHGAGRLLKSPAPKAARTRKHRVTLARRVRRVMVGITCCVVASTLWSPRAEAIPNPVDWVIDGVGNIVGGGVSAVASAVADALFGKVLEFITGLIAAAVTKATELLVSVFDAVTVKIGDNGVLNGGLSASLQTQMLALAAALLVLFFIIRIISALITQQMGKVARELFFDLPFTVIGTAAASVIGVLVLKLTDEMSTALSGGFAENLGAFAGQYFTATALLGGGLFQILFAVLYILGAIFVGLELIVRASLLTIIFVVAPVMIATRTWEGSRRYSRRFIEISLALMFAKPAAAMALAIGAAQMADGANATSPVQMMLGTTIVLMAAFMPFAIFKLIPVVEGAASVQQGIKGAPVRVAQTVAGFATTAALLSASGATGAASGTATGPANGGPGSTGTIGGGGGAGGGAGGGGAAPGARAAPGSASATGATSNPSVVGSSSSSSAVSTSPSGRMSASAENSAGDSPRPAVPPPASMSFPNQRPNPPGSSPRSPGQAAGTSAGGGESAVIVDNGVAADPVPQPVRVAESATVPAAAPVLRGRQATVRAADQALRSIPTARTQNFPNAQADDDRDEQR